MDKVIIGFCHSDPRPIGSRIISMIEGTPYSHTYVKFYSESLKRNIIYHATLDKLHFLSEHSFRKHVKVVHEFELEVTKEQKIEGLRYCVDMAGREYGIRQIVGMLFVRLVHRLTGKRMMNPLSDGEATQVCSETIYYVIEQMIPNANIDMDPEFDGPKEIFKWLVNNAEHVYDFNWKIIY